MDSSTTYQPTRREQELEKELARRNRENARLRRKLEFLLVGSSADTQLQNLTICNVTYQNISLESREQVEKLLYRMSANKDVLDQHSTWKLPKARSSGLETKAGGFDFSPSSSVDLAKKRHFSGSVQYLHDFTLDASAWPSPDLHRMEFKLWEPPYYTVDVDETLPVNWKERRQEERSKRGGGGAGNGCFNCGSTSHSLSGCLKPKDQERIRKALNEWRRSRIEDGGEVRYHGAGNSGSENLRVSSGVRSTPNTPSHQPPKAGVISERLRQALGIDPGQMPPWYRHFVYYGYPPSYYRVPPPPVKFSWIEPEDGTVETTPQKATIQQPQQRRRIRTVAYPNLAAPLHDLSMFFDLYHPVEEQDAKSDGSSTGEAPGTTSTPTAKYQVTTTLDGKLVPSSSHSASITDKSGDQTSAIAQTPIQLNPKKRARSDSVSSPYSSRMDVDSHDPSDDSDLPSESVAKIAKLVETEDSVDSATNDDAADWAQEFLDRLVESKLLPREEADTETDNAENGDFDVDPQAIASNLPISTGIITHNLTEADLSTHGAVQTTSGIWQKLKAILQDRHSHNESS